MLRRHVVNGHQLNEADAKRVVCSIWPISGAMTYR
jgi:hypothetical protein